MPVELAGIRLTHLTRLAVRESTRIVRHPVPGMQGDLAQVLGRPSVEVELSGVLFGPAAPEELERLREAHDGGAPVSFYIQGTDESELVQTLHFSEVLLGA